MGTRSIGAMAAFAVLAGVVSTEASGKVRTEPSGQELYRSECARCHGWDGRGDGPDSVFFSPRPRDLTTGFLEKYDSKELVARVKDGTPLVIEIDPEAVRKRLRNVEEILAHVKRLPSIDWKKVDEGGRIYAARCEPCHGAFGEPWPDIVLPRGVQKPPRDLRDPLFQKKTSDAQLVSIFEHGHQSMPAAAPQLTPAQAADLVAFVRLLSPGFETFTYYCAPCHGDDGRGRGILAFGENRPKVVLDAAYFKDKDDEELSVRIWHMLEGSGTMPHFQDTLDDAQLEAIFEYLRRQPK